MDTIKQNLGWVVVVAAFLIFGTAFVLSAQESDDINPPASQSSNTEEKTKENKPSDNATNSQQTDQKSIASKPYEYTAQAGDSYSVLARKAVQSYGIINRVKLSLAQVVAAETRLTLIAESPYLNEGQTVTLDNATIKSAIDTVMKMPVDEVAAWETYVPTVNFNTNANGQAA